MLGFKVVRDLGEGGNEQFEKGLKSPSRVAAPRSCCLAMISERRASI
jgi:hypothetical protein